MDYSDQTITVKYSDVDVTVQCPYDTIQITQNGIFVIDYNKLINEVGKQLEKEMDKRRNR